MKLSSYRKRHKLTLLQMAELVGVTEVSMSRYESGERVPRHDIMRKIETVTEGKVRPNDFISENG